MQYCINEMSFIGQFSDVYDGSSALNNLIHTIDATTSIRNLKPILRTENLKYKNFTADLTIHEFLIQLNGSCKPKDKDLLQKILMNLVKGPYLKVFSSINKLENGSGECLLNTAIHFAFDNELTHSTISIEKSKFDVDRIDLNSNGILKTINNYLTVKSISESKWLYEESPKHKIPVNKIVKGNVWSAMPLSVEIAQKVLSNSISLAGKRTTYALFEGQWFQFYNHHSNLYHGFPISDPGNDVDLNRIKKFILGGYGWDLGQITID